MLSKIFDEYERKARLYPALIVISPIILDIYLIVPEIRNLSSTFASVLASLGLLELLAYVSRSGGKSKEKMLFNHWGGIPTSRFLRNSDTTIDPLTKKRYHNFLMKSIRDYKIPSLEDEVVNLASADSIYESGIRWLREKTRDKKAYPLVFKENVGYGFSRNLWALKNMSILLLIVSILLNVTVFYIKQGKISLSYTYEFWIANAISFILLLIWIFFINKSFVKNAAEAYARALLATCDDISGSINETPKKRASKNDNSKDINI